jgi:hypothetical protein
MWGAAGSGHGDRFGQEPDGLGDAMLGQSGEAEHQGRRPAACNPQRRDPLDGHAMLGSRVSGPQPTAGDPRGDTSAAQGPLAGRVVVTLVAMQFGRSPARPTRPTAWPDSSMMLAPLPCDASVVPQRCRHPGHWAELDRAMRQRARLVEIRHVANFPCQSVIEQLSALRPLSAAERSPGRPHRT